MKQPLKFWILATRPWSFPASSMPVIVTMAFLFFQTKNEILSSGLNWGYGVLALIGVIFIHAAGNIISDYYDFKHGVDKKESYGGSKMLTEGVFKPALLKTFGLILMFIGAAIGGIMLLGVGIELLWIGLFGVITTYFYYKFKYNALGDLLILIIYGPMIGLGTAFVMTGTLHWEVLLLNIPVAMLVDNILHANNTRDINFDKAANIKTQAMILGVKASKIQYVVFALGAYIVVILMVVVGMLPWLSLATLLTVPVALKNINAMMQAEDPDKIKMLDAMSAQLVMLFSLVLAISMAVSVLF